MDWVTVIVGGLVAVSIIAWWTKRKDNLPHRRGLPIVGNLLQLKGKKLHLELTEWGKDLGGIFSVRLGHKRLVALNSYEAIQEALTQKGPDFAYRPVERTYRLNFLCGEHLGVAMSQYSPFQKKMRQVFHSSVKMSDSGLKDTEEVNQQMIGDLVEGIQAFNGKSFNPEKLVYSAVVNAIFVLVIGKTYSHDHELVEKTLRFETVAMRAFSPLGKGRELDSFPWLRFFGNSTYKLLLEANELRDYLFKTMLKESVGQNVGLMTNMRRILNEEFGKDSKDAMDRLRAVTLFSTILPGTGTTSRSILSYMNTICQLPEIQKKLQDEVDNVVGRDRYVSLDDREKLPYTHATVLELMRFATVAAQTLPHTCLKDTQICGKTIPAHSTVVLNLWALHHDESFWDEPFNFNPERFLTDEGEVVSPAHPNRRHLKPFGAGPRMCLGSTMAKSRLFLIIATLAQKFTLKKGNVTAPLDPRTYRPLGFLKPHDFEVIAEVR